MSLLGLVTGKPARPVSSLPLRYTDGHLMAVANWKNQTVWTGDNLPIMRGMNSESVDLIYLDPPFNSKQDYAAPIGSKAAGAEFKDTWTLSDVDAEWINLIAEKHPALHRVLLAAMTASDKSYLVYMAARILEMKRLLKPTGSIYLHCDPTMSHYLKLVMDAIFGRDAFQNEIVWGYRTGGVSKKRWPRKHDILLFYAGRGYAHNPEMERLIYSKPFFTDQTDEIGQYYADVYVRDVWEDVKAVINVSKERVGYPTQKPIKLLHRIIRASSSEGLVVLDPFCGCATACIAAELEGRLWTGIDISPKAAELVKDRLRREAGMFYEGAVRKDIPRRTDLGKIPPYNSAANRKLLYGEQAGTCPGCAEHFKLQNLTVDHIIARSKGGTDHIENLQLLCGHCNSVKGDRGMEYLKAKLQI